MPFLDYVRCTYVMSVTTGGASDTRVYIGFDLWWRLVYCVPTKPKVTPHPSSTQFKFYRRILDGPPVVIPSVLQPLFSKSSRVILVWGDPKGKFLELVLHNISRKFSGFFSTIFQQLLYQIRVDMSKALQLAYTLHPKTLTNSLLAYSLTKPLTHFKSMYFYKFL